MPTVFYIASKAPHQDQENSVVKIHKCQFDKEKDSAIFSEVSLQGQTKSLTAFEYRPVTSATHDGFSVSGEGKFVHLKVNKDDTADVTTMAMPDARIYHGMFSGKTISVCIGGQIQKDAVETVYFKPVGGKWYPGPPLRNSSMSPIATGDTSRIFVLTDSLCIYFVYMTTLADSDNAPKASWTRLSITIPADLPQHFGYNTGISMVNYHHYSGGSSHGLLIVGGFLSQTFLVKEVDKNKYTVKTVSKPNEDHSNGALFQLKNWMFLWGGCQGGSGTQKCEKFEFGGAAWTSSAISLPDGYGDPVYSNLS